MGRGEGGKKSQLEETRRGTEWGYMGEGSGGEEMGYLLGASE